MKRRREQELQERARAKHARRGLKRSEPRAAGGPQIAWDEAVGLTTTGTATGASEGDAAVAAPAESASAVVDTGGGGGGGDDPA